MTNVSAIATFYKGFNKCHTYSIGRKAGLKILVSAVRFRLRAPTSRLFPTVKHPLGTMSLATLCGSIPYPVRLSECYASS